MGRAPSLGGAVCVRDVLFILNAIWTQDKIYILVDPLFV
jgi:hypothetical protein